MFGYGRYEGTNRLLNERFGERKRLVAVHRSGWGGNIPQSSDDAFRAGILMGGDMMEIDLSLDRDGEVWVFHDGNEMQLFRETRNIREIPTEEVRALDIINPIGERTGKHLSTLDGLLSVMGDDVLFNIDRPWKKLPEMDRVIERHPEKIRQALVKTHAEEDSLDFLARCPRKYMYMSVVSSEEEIDRVLSYGESIDLVGFELISAERDGGLFRREVIERIHSLGLFCWGNALSLGSAPRFNIAGGLGDDLAIREGFDVGWGPFLEKGFDVIQTDWPSLLSRYLRERE